MSHQSCENGDEDVIDCSRIAFFVTLVRLSTKPGSLSQTVGQSVSLSQPVLVSLSVYQSVCEQTDVRMNTSYVIVESHSEKNQ